jgi:hypothetical protein
MCWFCAVCEPLMIARNLRRQLVKNKTVCCSLFLSFLLLRCCWCRSCLRAALRSSWGRWSGRACWRIWRRRAAPFRCTIWGWFCRADWRWCCATSASSICSTSPIAPTAPQEESPAYPAKHWSERERDLMCLFAHKETISSCLISMFATFRSARGAG